MAERQVYQKSFNQVAQVDRSAERQAIGNLAKETAGVLIQRQLIQDNIKITKFKTEADLEVAQENEKYRNLNAENPSDKEAYDKHLKSVDKIYAKYDEQIGLSAKANWNKTKNRSKDRQNVDNSKWIMAQNVKNAKRNSKESADNSTKKSYINGKTGDFESELIDIAENEADTRVAYNETLGVDNVNEQLKTLRSSKVKSFILGAISSDPKKAMVLLDNSKVTDEIDSPKAVETLRTACKTQIKRNEYDAQVSRKAKYIAATNELVGDLDSLTLADIENLYTSGEIEEEDAKTLTTFKVNAVYATKVDNQTFNNINDMISGVKLKSNGTKYEDSEISREILTGASKMTKEATSLLVNSLGERRENGEASLVGIEVGRIRKYLNNINNGDIDVEDAVSFFNKTCLEKKLTGDKVEELANGVKIAETMKIDSTFQSKDDINKNLRNLKRYKVGTIIENEQTGEKQHLNVDGRWLPFN